MFDVLNPLYALHMYMQFATNMQRLEDKVPSAPPLYILAKSLYVWRPESGLRLIHDPSFLDEPGRLEQRL